MLRECEGDGNAGVGDGGGVWMSSGHEYVCGTRSSDIVYNAANMLGMNVMKGVGRVDKMCMCLARGGVGGEGGVDKRIGFVLYQSCRNRGSVGRVSVFGLR